VADDFFKEEKQEEPEQKTETLKVGEKQLTQDQLDELVKLGEQAKDWQDKSGSSLKDLKQKFGKRGERIGDFKKKLEGFEKAKVEEIAKKPQKQLSPE
jgi:hypothetical protein